MDREQQIAEMAVDINDCITEFVTDVGDVYTDDEATAQKMFDKGYRKQSKVVKEIFEEIDNIIYNLRDSPFYSSSDAVYELTELTKKYTEELENDKK